MVGVITAYFQSRYIAGKLVAARGFLVTRHYDDNRNGRGQVSALLSDGNGEAHHRRPSCGMMFHMVRVRVEAEETAGTIFVPMLGCRRRRRYQTRSSRLLSPMNDRQMIQ